MKKSFIFLSILLLFAVADSIAMSLGRHRGAVLIGRPLDISVQAVLDGQEDLSSLCLDADVFYADNKLDKSRVRVTAEKTSPTSQDAVIRIRSAVVIDEPVVTVYLRVGCQQKTEKRYVALADLVSDTVPEKTGQPALPPVAPSLPVARPRASTDQPITDQAAAKPARRSKSRALGAAEKPLGGGQTEGQTGTSSVTAPLLKSLEAAPKPRNLRTDNASKSGKVAGRSGARLKLEPLDLTIERDPQLKSSAELLSVPASSLQERSAAAALWQALRAQPQDTLRDTEKLQALESSIRSLQAQTQKNQLAIDDLGAKLQKAQAERYANALVYALGILLLAALAAVAYLLRARVSRQRVVGDDLPWWRKNANYQEPQKGWVNSLPQADPYDSDNSVEPKKKGFGGGAKPLSPGPHLNLNFGQPGAAKAKHVASPDSDSLPPSASNFRQDFALSMTHPSRAVKAEELFDVQQQADFFVSIGQHEQAIEVLRSHIGEGVETSALVYLDLFNLYHQLNRAPEYEALRADFNQRFNTKIPTFELYTDSGPGLESYQSALSRIEALWPSPKVLDIIEESIFRRPDTNAVAFNLEAYRELLLLYAVAKEIISPEAKAAARPKKFDLPDAPRDATDSGPMTFMSTSIQPLSASIDEDGQQALHGRAGGEPLLASVVPLPSPRLGLDLDLSEMADVGDRSLLADAQSDAQFFAQFDDDAHAPLPALAPASAALAGVATQADNLIDFDAFDSAMNVSEKFKKT